MLARTSSNNLINPEGKSLSKSLRLFDDFTAHMNETASVTAYSTQVFTRMEKRLDFDPNNDDIIFDRQVQEEFINYIRMSFKRLEHRSTLAPKSINTLFEEKQWLFQIESLLDKGSKLGEVNELYEYAWEVFKLENTRKAIRENNLLRIEKLQEKRGRLFRRFEWLLVTVIGLFGVTGLSSEVVKPTWLALGWWTPPDEWKPAFFFLTSTASVITLLWIIFFVVLRSETKS